MGLRRTPQNTNNGVPCTRLTDLPPELREMIWRHVLNLDLDDITQGRVVEIAVTRQITRNSALRRTQGNRAPASLDVLFQYFNPRASREIQNPLNLLLINHQTQLEIQMILNRSAEYISELRHLTPYDRRGPSQEFFHPGAAQTRIYFNRRLDTIYMGALAMMHYTEDFWDLYSQANETDENDLALVEPMIHGLNEVLNVAFPGTLTGRESRRALNVLAYFIPASQIPLLPWLERKEGDWNEQEIAARQNETGFVHFPNATATFLEPFVPEQTIFRELGVLNTQIRNLNLTQADPTWSAERIGAWNAGSAALMNLYIERRLLPAFRKLILEQFLNRPEE